MQQKELKILEAQSKGSLQYFLDNNYEFSNLDSDYVFVSDFKAQYS
jgi:hypothetical protein